MELLLRHPPDDFVRPSDDPLPWLLANPRGLESKAQDLMWLSMVEVPRALQARSYDAEASAVIQIRDDFCPWNQVCYKLIVSPDRSICQPTTQASDLGAVYLGATSLETLMRTGRIQELESGIVSQLDRAFAVERQPWMVDA